MRLPSRNFCLFFSHHLQAVLRRVQVWTYASLTSRAEKSTGRISSLVESVVVSELLAITITSLVDATLPVLLFTSSDHSYRLAA